MNVKGINKKKGVEFLTLLKFGIVAVSTLLISTLAGCLFPEKAAASTEPPMDVPTVSQIIESSAKPSYTPEKPTPTPTANPTATPQLTIEQIADKMIYPEYMEGDPVFTSSVFVIEYTINGELKKVPCIAYGYMQDGIKVNTLCAVFIVDEEIRDYFPIFTSPEDEFLKCVDGWDGKKPDSTLFKVVPEAYQNQNIVVTDLYGFYYAGGRLAANGELLYEHPDAYIFDETEHFFTLREFAEFWATFYDYSSIVFPSDFGFSKDASEIAPEEGMNHSPTPKM